MLTNGGLSSHGESKRDLESATVTSSGRCSSARFAVEASKGSLGFLNLLFTKNPFPTMWFTGLHGLADKRASTLGLKPLSAGSKARFQLHVPNKQKVWKGAPSELLSRPYAEHDPSFLVQMLKHRRRLWHGSLALDVLGTCRREGASFCLSQSRCPLTFS